MGAVRGVGVAGEPERPLAQVGAVAAGGVGRGLVEKGVDEALEGIERDARHPDKSAGSRRGSSSSTPARAPTR